MPKWIISYTDRRPEEEIEADSVSVAGTVVAFLTHSKIAAPDGKIAGIPTAFVDLSNPNVVLVKMAEEKVAEVLSIV